MVLLRFAVGFAIRVGLWFDAGLVGGVLFGAVLGFVWMLDCGLVN